MVRLLDVVWMGKGWHSLIPRFQAILDHKLSVTPARARIRIAPRLSNGSLDLLALNGPTPPVPCRSWAAHLATGANVLIPTMERCTDEHLVAAGPELSLVYQPVSSSGAPL